MSRVLPMIRCSRGSLLPSEREAHPGIRLWCFNKLNLILRSPAKRSEAGRLEGWAAYPQGGLAFA